VVLGQAIHQQRLGIEVSILAVQDTYTCKDLQGYDLGSVNVRTFPRYGIHRVAYAPALREALLSADSDNAVVHLHGIWMYISAATLPWSKKKHGVHVVAPHSMLNEKALQRSRWKKFIVSRLWENENLRRASCLQALTLHEYESIRRYGLTNPVCVVANGVNLQEFSDLPDRSLFSNAFPQVKDRKILLFLSRLHPQKGLPNLLKAWSSVTSKNKDWVLVIAGPEFSEVKGYRQELMNLARALGIEGSTLFVGPLYGAMKYQAYAAANAFVLPSLYEGFASAVLEALACRLPVLITRDCCFDDVGKIGAGLVTGPEEASLKDGLCQLLELSDAARAEMGARGRKLVERKFTWEAIAREMVAVYDWLLNGGHPPACVILK
jgi:poly(glycerol-phosphate) alpha-glucosyltransferase